MNTQDQLIQLMKAVMVLKKLPHRELAENGKLTDEIKKVISGKSLQKIMGSMWREYQQEQNEKLHASNSKRYDEESILKPYTDFQSSVFKNLKDNATASITDLISKSEVMAFNARIKIEGNPLKSKKIELTKEATNFKKAFNSIYSDTGLQINSSSDPTILSSFIDYSPYTINYLHYLSVPTLDQTIDLPINIATRQDPIIDFDDEELTKKFKKYFKRSKINSKIRKLLFYSALSPRGSLIVPINENGHIRFNVFNDTQFTYSTSQQYSMIDFQDTNTGVGQLFCLGHLLQNEVTAHFLCPGFEPIYAIGKNRLYRLKDAAEAINIYLYTIKVLCIRAQVLVQKWSGEGQNDTKLQQLQKLTQRINTELSLSTAVELPADADLDILNNNLSPGFADVQPIIKEFQGMITGVMPDYFYGSQTAYAANSFNLNVTHQNIRSQIQEAQITPALQFITNSVLRNDERFSKFKGEVDNFDITFESIYEMTDQEKAELNSKKIDNITKMADYPELVDYFKQENLWRKDQDASDPLDPNNLDDAQTIAEREGT